MKEDSLFFILAKSAYLNYPGEHIDSTAQPPLQHLGNATPSAASPGVLCNQSLTLTWRSWSGRWCPGRQDHALVALLGSCGKGWAPTTARSVSSQALALCSSNKTPGSSVPKQIPICKTRWKSGPWQMITSQNQQVSSTHCFLVNLKVLGLSLTKLPRTSDLVGRTGLQNE